MDAEKIEAEVDSGRNDNRQVLQAIIIDVGDDVRRELAEKQVTPSSSRQPSKGKTKDPWSLIQGKYIAPPYPPMVLSKLIENSSVLGPCIEAMEINVESFGYRIAPAKPDLIKGKEEAVITELLEEKYRAELFFEECGNEYSFTKLRRLTRKDLELTGNAYWEIIETRPGSQEIDWMNLLPAYTVRLGKVDPALVQVTYKKRIWDGKKVTYVNRPVQRRFRKFVQVREGNDEPIWFKEWGDPRPMKWRTGEFLKEGEKLKDEDAANSILHFRLDCFYSPYGLPRFMGNLFALFGARSAESVNFFTLSNNNIPSMILAVSNGVLTDGTITRLKEFVNTQIKGKSNYSKFLILEAEPVMEGVREPGAMKIDIKPLTSDQIQDAMFVNYDKNSRAKIRESWRLPGLFIGETEGVNRATADALRTMTDEQVFNPERIDMDSIINQKILPYVTSVGIPNWRFRSNTPNITSDDDLVRLLSAGERTGGLTPEIARRLMEMILGEELGEIDPSTLPPDVPFTLTVAREAKNTAPVNMGTVAGIENLSGRKVKEVDPLDVLLGVSNALELQWGEIVDSLYNDDDEPDSEITED